jgi:hypothetical protein
VERLGTFGQVAPGLSLVAPPRAARWTCGGPPSSSPAPRAARPRSDLHIQLFTDPRAGQASPWTGSRRSQGTPCVVDAGGPRGPSPGGPGIRRDVLRPGWPPPVHGRGRRASCSALGLTAVPGDQQWTSAGREPRARRHRVPPLSQPRLRGPTPGSPHTNRIYPDTGLTNRVTYYCGHRAGRASSGYSNEAAPAAGQSPLPAEVRFDPRGCPGVPAVSMPGRR